MNYLFTSESVSEGHPDKVADQISDAILDEFLRQDPEAKVACETFCSTGLVVIMGEVRSEDAYVDIQTTVRNTIKRIGYDKADYMFDGNSCGVMSALHEQSKDINRGVVREDPDEQGAGDQGMMFGYACSDTREYMPLPLTLSHLTLRVLADIRHHEPELMSYLRPDAKTQYTIEYDGETHRPVKVHTIVVSIQHDEFVAPAIAGIAGVGEASGSGDCACGVSGNDYGQTGSAFCGSMSSSGEDREAAGTLTYSEACEKYGEAFVDKAMHDKIEEDVRNILLPHVKAALPAETAALFGEDIILHVNPTGKFVIGGPHGDTGLTGRKIVVDTYGGKGAHGGGAFSGKDPSKVDRSGAYMARYIAKNMVAAGVADEMLVQIAYAIGVARPVGIYVDTYGTAAKSPDGKTMDDGCIASKIPEIFDLRPAAIIDKFQLKYPIYEPTAAYGHFGREPYTAMVGLKYGGKDSEREVQFFGWEKLDAVDAIRRAFGINQDTGFSTKPRTSAPGL